MNRCRGRPAIEQTYPKFPFDDFSLSIWGQYENIFTDTSSINIL